MSNYTNRIFSGQIDLSGSKIDKKLVFNSCRFRGPVNLQSSTFHSTLEFIGCVFENRLIISDAIFHQGLTITNSSILNPLDKLGIKGRRVQSNFITFFNVFIMGGVDLSHATIEKDLNIGNILIDGMLDLTKSTIKGGVSLSATDLAFPFFVLDYLSLMHLKSRYIDVIGIQVDGEMTLYLSTIEQYVNFSSSKVDNKYYLPVNVGCKKSFGLSLYGMQIKNNFLAFEGIDVAGNLDLNVVKVGSGLFFRSTVYYPLGSHIGGSLEMSGLEAPKGVWVEGVSIGEKLNATGIKTGDLKLVPAITLEEKEPRRQILDASKSEIIIKHVSVGGKSVDGKPELVGKIDFSFSTITGRAWFIGINSYGGDGTDSPFPKSLDMRNSDIEKNLRFADFEEELLGRLENTKKEFKKKFKKENEPSTKLENPLVDATFLYHLKGKVWCDKPNHHLYFKGFMTDKEKRVLLEISKTAVYKSAIEKLFKDSQIAHEVSVELKKTPAEIIFISMFKDICIHEYQKKIHNKLPFGVDLSMTRIGGDLAISNVDCSKGVINLSDANIGRNASITNNCKERNQAPVTANSLKARSITCGGDFDLTGLDLSFADCADSKSRSVDARNATINGVMRICPNPEDEKEKGCSFAKIPGKLDLEASHIDRLVVSNQSFPLPLNKGDKKLDPNRDNALILRQSRIGTLRIYFSKKNMCNEDQLFPRPVDLLFADINNWDFKDRDNPDDQDDGSENANYYIRFLSNSLRTYLHAYRAVENTLFLRGNEEAANKIHIAFREKQITKRWKDAKDMIKNIRFTCLWGFIRSLLVFLGEGISFCTHKVWGSLSGFGTTTWALILLVLSWLLISSCIFSIPDNISPSQIALAATNSKLTLSSNPLDIGGVMTKYEKNTLIDISKDEEFQKTVKALFLASRKGEKNCVELEKLPAGVSIPKNIKDTIQYDKSKKCLRVKPQWDWWDGFLVAIRYHVPMLNLGTRDEWEPSSNDLYLLDNDYKFPWGTPEIYAVIVSGFSWLLIPIIVFIVSRKIIRRRGAD